MRNVVTLRGDSACFVMCNDNVFVGNTFVNRSKLMPG
jgi:hypothetical protein